MIPKNNRWMIYGASGYSGRLIALEAKKRGHKPLLAGRNAEKLKVISDKLGLPYRVFSLDTTAEELDAQLKDIQLLLNCAGPFSQTSEPLIQACLSAKCNYLDITGEINVFEALYKRHSQASEENIVICPGVGFDVIPTDAVATVLKNELPDATHLSLSFSAPGGISPGTAKTGIEGLKEKTKIRKNGKLISVPAAKARREIPFADKRRKASLIGLADVATAFYNTGIPNIETWLPMPTQAHMQLKASNYVRAVLKLTAVQSRLKNKAAATLKGPNKAQREKFSAQIWGEVTNKAGESVQAILTTCNAYKCTIHGALGVVEYVLSNRKHIQGGYYTPTQLVGPQFISTLPGCSDIQILPEALQIKRASA
ncbi:MAG: hypothetical protein COB04_13865 [Gammaproteobacteria bacterium]|nr:MAG: hypothetical protein COB04_13865 [Gammaproteobacteria bacterium]